MQTHSTFFDACFGLEAKHKLSIEQYYSVVGDFYFDGFQAMTVKEFKEIINSDWVIIILFNLVNSEVFKLVRRLIEDEPVDQLTKMRIKKLCDKRIEDFAPKNESCISHFGNELDKIEVKGRPKAGVAQDLLNLLVKEELCKRNRESNFFIDYFGHNFDVSQHYSIEEQDVINRYYSTIANSFDFECFGNRTHQEIISADIILSNILKQISAKTFERFKRKLQEEPYECEEMRQRLEKICDSRIAACEPKVVDGDIQFCNELDEIIAVDIDRCNIDCIANELVGILFPIVLNDMQI